MSVTLAGEDCSTRIASLASTRERLCGLSEQERIAMFMLDHRSVERGRASDGRGADLLDSNQSESWERGWNRLTNNGKCRPCCSTDPSARALTGRDAALLTNSLRKSRGDIF